MDEIEENENKLLLIDKLTDNESIKTLVSKMAILISITPISLLIPQLNLFVEIPAWCLLFSIIINFLVAVLRFMMSYASKVILLIMNLDFILHLLVLIALNILLYFITDVLSFAGLTSVAMTFICTSLSADTRDYPEKVTAIANMMLVISSVVIVVCFFFSLDRLQTYYVHLLDKSIELRSLFIDKYIFLTILIARIFYIRHIKHDKLFLFKKLNL